MATEQALVTRPHINIDKAIDEWIANKKQSHSGSEKTETAYRDTLKSFRDMLGHGDLDLDADPREIIRLAPFWASSRHPKAKRTGKVADSTYNQRLAVVSSFYSFLQRVYRLDIENPISSVDKKRVQAYKYAQPLDPDDVMYRLACIPRDTVEGKRNYALLCLGFMTGRRAQELLDLQWKHIAIEDGAYVATFEHCKGDKQMKDELEASMVDAIFDYLKALYGDLGQLDPDTFLWVSFSRANRGKPLSVHTLYDLCENYLGISKIHALRHTFAKQMEAAGATLSEIQERLGHERIETTARYLKTMGSAKNKHASALAQRFGIIQQA